jgi:hypothetical protein
MMVLANDDSRRINEAFHTVRTLLSVFTVLNIVFPDSFHASMMVHAINAPAVPAF